MTFNQEDHRNLPPKAFIYKTNDMKTKEEILKEIGLGLSIIHSSKGSFSTFDAMQAYSDDQLEAYKAKLKEKVKASGLSGLSKAAVYALINSI